MRVLVVGGGGREHSLVWRLKQSPQAPEIFCAPGNAGMVGLAECVDIAATDVERLLEFARRNQIDLTVVGPEAPLCAGLADAFADAGLSVFGPKARAAALEGDKSLAKDIMVRQNIPTANHRTFTETEAALAFVQETVDYPLVVKASGLAAGKGVIICQNAEEAETAVTEMMVDNRFGEAGGKIVIEDFLVGEEVSVIAITDGSSICVFESSQDHKRAHDGDKGPNTGGMGAYSPAPVFTEELQEQVEREVLVPIVHGMAKEGRPISGVVYAGLMLTSKGPRVLEFNVRFGDPECQVLMARFTGDLLDVLDRCARGQLQDAELSWDSRPSVSIVMAQEGYPGPLTQGCAIANIEAAEALDDVTVFHAGTRINDLGVLYAAGGRVLNVTALGDDLQGAVNRAYEAVDAIDFPSSFHRRDIGHRALT